MSFTQILPYCVFIAVVLGIWAAAKLLTTKESRAEDRLDVLKGKKGRADELAKETQFSNAFNKAAPSLSKVLEPKTEEESSKLRIKLANAGYSSPNASMVFLAIKLISAIALAFLFGSGLSFFKGLGQDALIAFAFGGGIGMFLPDTILSIMAWSRKSQIFLSLPDALDLLVVCVEAGLGLDAAMRRVAEELEETGPAITSEINHANFQLQMGRPRRDVLHDLGVRTGVDDVKALAAILIQADKFGSSIAQALRVQSDSMRVKRSQLAEEKAAMTAVKMIFPLVLFIFPGIFVVLVGPAAILMIRQLLTT